MNALQDKTYLHHVEYCKIKIESRILEIPNLKVVVKIGNSQHLRLQKISSFYL